LLQGNSALVSSLIDDAKGGDSEAVLALAAIPSVRGDAALRKLALVQMRQGSWSQNFGPHALIHASLPKQGDSVEDEEVFAVLLRYSRDSSEALRALPRFAKKGWCEMSVMHQLANILADNQFELPVSEAHAALTAFEEFVSNCPKKEMREIWKFIAQRYSDRERDRACPTLVYAVKHLMPHKRQKEGGVHQEL